MTSTLTRRSALGLGAAATAAATLGEGTAVAEILGPQHRIRRTYWRQRAMAGGDWHSYVTVVDDAGAMRAVIEDDADHVIGGASVQKLAVATAVMDKVDRGELRLDQKLDLTADIILGGSGFYFHQTVYGDDLTLANILTAMLLVSDNTAVRLCGRVVPGPEINEILAAKGFVQTRVEPVPTNPNRFFLGNTTPREMNDLLQRLASKTLLSPQSCDFLLGITRGPNGYHDGVRRVMSSAERVRVATKYGALDDKRHEAGIMFDAQGAAVLVYAFFAERLDEPDNYGSTNPAVQAHAALGRAMFDAIASTTNPAPAAHFEAPRLEALNGG